MKTYNITVTDTTATILNQLKHKWNLSNLNEVIEYLATIHKAK